MERERGARARLRRRHLIELAAEPQRQLLTLFRVDLPTKNYFSNEQRIKAILSSALNERVLCEGFCVTYIRVSEEFFLQNEQKFQTT